MIEHQESGFPGEALDDAQAPDAAPPILVGHARGARVAPLEQIPEEPRRDTGLLGMADDGHGSSVAAQPGNEPREQEGALAGSRGRAEAEKRQGEAQVRPDLLEILLASGHQLGVGIGKEHRVGLFRKLGRRPAAQPRGGRLPSRPVAGEGRRSIAGQAGGSRRLRAQGRAGQSAGDPLQTSSHHGGARGAELLLLRQQLVDQIGNLVGGPGPHLADGSVGHEADPAQGFRGVRRQERGTSGQSFVEQDPEREEVGSGVGLAVQNLFRGEPSDRPREPALRRPRRRRAGHEALSQTEIEDLRAAG